MASTEKTLESLANRLLDLDAKIQNTEAIERQKITNKDTYDFVESKKIRTLKEKHNRI
ncbi:hypothetical protein DPMN_085715 [Dreissena polymorpha]|uniref:Uncharacterized protein n=1 Tax=Dreissena polymorpha TaxID=45954 RepID=A0A9D4BD37_DREPO|nr:hypothetical protein DPMN_085715 [Dreissena polymorpha]